MKDVLRVVADTGIHCDVEARDIEARDVEARDIEARDVEARDVGSRDVGSRDVGSRDVKAHDDIGPTNARRVLESVANGAAPYASRLVERVVKVAPRTVARVVRRLLFKPIRRKLPAAAQALLAQAHIEDGVVDGRHICYYVWGDSGPRVLLIHGWGGAAASMTEFVEPLRRLGFRVIALDLPAHGRSSGVLASVKHFEPCIAQAAKTYGAFNAVIAHSLGASAVTFALSRGLPCQRAVFVAPVTHYASLWRRFQRRLHLPSSVMTLALEDAQRWLGITFDEMEPARLAQQMTMPLLVIHDREDPEVPIEECRTFVAHWANATLQATESLGHDRILREAKVIEQAVAFLTP